MAVSFCVRDRERVCVSEREKPNPDLEKSIFQFFFGSGVCRGEKKGPRESERAERERRDSESETLRERQTLRARSLSRRERQPRTTRGSPTSYSRTDWR